VQITSDGLVTNSRTVSVQDELGKLYNVTVVGVTNVDEALPYYFS